MCRKKYFSSASEETRKTIIPLDDSIVPDSLCLKRGLLVRVQGMLVSIHVEKIEKKNETQIVQFIQDIFIKAPSGNRRSADRAIASNNVSFTGYKMVEVLYCNTDILYTGVNSIH